MSDIAAHLGVSRLTVSAVLNGREQEVGVGDETATRVRKAAEDLGYHRNHLALAMKTGRNPVIGCLVSDLKSEWTSRTLSGLLRQLHESGYLLKIEEVSGPEEETPALTRFIEQRLAGIFCNNFNPGESFARSLEKAAQNYSMPIVCSLSRKDIAGGWIDSDDRQGVRLAVDHLWALGHRRIAFLGGGPSEHIRTEGFVEAMRDHGVEPPAGFVVATDWSLSCAERETEQLLRKVRGRPTAIMSANDKMAAIVLRTAHREGLRVPRDVSVVGFSDSDICELTDPELTSISQPFEKIGQLCGSALIDLIKTAGRNKHPADIRQFVPTELVVRQSSGPVPDRIKKD